VKQYIEDRVYASAHYILENKSTIRQTAKYVGVSKSTTHKDLSERLPQLNKTLYNIIKHEVIEVNKAERHIRGGWATKKKDMRRQSNMTNLTFTMTLDSFQQIAKHSNITVKEFLNLLVWLYTDKLNEASESEDFITLTEYHLTHKVKCPIKDVNASILLVESLEAPSKRKNLVKVYTDFQF
jgi:putative DeoR family transcriptional regulator (stage III sporulation protein D)